MEESTGQSRLGRFFSFLGYAWGLLYLASNFLNAGGTPLGDFLAFFGSSFFIPLVLIFSGRTFRKRAERHDSDELESNPTPSSRKPVRQFSEQSTTKSKPVGPIIMPTPSPTKTWPEVGSSSSHSPPPRSSGAEPSRPASSRQSDELPPVEDILEPDLDLFDTGRQGEFKPKTSEEMIAEAKKRLAGKG
jgi:hypothetical protein